MSKYSLTKRERKELWTERQVELLLALDLDLVHNYSNADKRRMIAEQLECWEREPSIRTLYHWRENELYQQRRQQLLNDEGSAEKMQHWAAELFQDGVVKGYAECVARELFHLRDDCTTGVCPVPEPPLRLPTKLAQPME